MSLITEDLLEQQCIEWFEEIGYQYKNGYDIAPDSSSPERDDHTKVILEDRLRTSLIKINPGIPVSIIENTLVEITSPNIPALLSCNKQFHNWLVKGLTITYMKDNEEIGAPLKLIDFDNLENNDWLVINQFTVQGTQRTRRPDLVIFVNGIPLGVIELKNPADEKADIWSAFNQLQTYKNNIPDLFNTNSVLVISDGIQARIGSLTANRERYMRWRTIDGKKLDPLGNHRDLETLVRGVFDKQRFLDYIRYFCVFSKEKEEIVKKIAGYHQFHAVQTALKTIIDASKADGNKQGGVVWHTQGSGKSLEMANLTAKILTNPQLENPTIVVVNDRQNLDGQLYEEFVNTGHLLGETPKTTDTRKELREHLDNLPSGGIIFTTIQKFGLEPNEKKFPTLTTRHNVIVICDEAHRTQYGFKGTLDPKTGQIKYGLARAMRDALPNATFIAFTGTPIEGDRDTKAVFGNYVDIYDIRQAVQDGATVPIYYESRLTKLKLKEKEKPKLDSKVEELFDDSWDDTIDKERTKSKWAQTESIVGAKPRLEKVASDIINHYETRGKTQPGKALIVSMSRNICVSLYDEIIKLRPEWHHEDHDKGIIKVVMTASASDDQKLQAHHTSKSQKNDLKNRFKNPSDSLQIVIVRDMWLTGFDAPCLTTMYIDKPMKGANLAQAIARVNRVFRDKPGGLIVDYIGISPQLKETLATYSSTKQKGKLIELDSNLALNVLKENIQVARDLLHPVDWKEFRLNALQLIPDCLDRILEQEEGKKRYCDTVLAMTRAFALCSTLDETATYTDEIAFHQAIRAPLIKTSQMGGRKEFKDSDFELKQLVSESLVVEDITDVFKLAGLDSPNISILSNEFLKEVENIPQKNLAVDLLNKLLNDEIKSKFHTNIVQQTKFSELLQNTLTKYQNRSIETAQVLLLLIETAKEVQQELEKGKKLNLNSAEKAFFDALANNKSAQDLMGDEILIQISREIAQKLRANLTIDWEIKESVRAKLRILIKTLLKKYKYPPDEQAEATELVLSQAELVSHELLKDNS